MKPRLLSLGLGLLLALTLVPAGQAEKCTSASGCEFWDNEYHEYVLGDWDTSKLDVLIVPSASAGNLADTEIIEHSIDAWESGIAAMGAPWLVNGLDIEHYTLGLDIPPADVLADPEIIIVSAEYNPFVLFGIGLKVPISFCHGLAPLGSAAWHQHEGSPWAVSRIQCEGGGDQCVVLNTNFLLGGERRLHDLNAHEFGHCLGVGHVGDALDFDVKRYPTEDIMSYEYTPSQVHCVSNLNIRTLEGVFADLLGAPTSVPRFVPGDFNHMSPSAYQQVVCPNP